MRRTRLARSRAARLALALLLIGALAAVGLAGAAAGKAVPKAPAPTPDITSIDPVTAPNNAPVRTQIHGTGFDLRVIVKLKLGTTEIVGRGTPRATLVVASFDITGAKPGTYDVYVENRDGKSDTLAAAFTITAAPPPSAKPHITKLKPTSGKRGIVATITGTAFGAKRGKSFVKFGAVKCSKYVSWGKTRIKCKVPAKAKFAKVKVKVTTTAGTSNHKYFKVLR